MGHNQSQSSISPTWPISTNHRTASLPTAPRRKPKRQQTRRPKQKQARRPKPSRKQKSGTIPYVVDFKKGIELIKDPKMWHVPSKAEMKKAKQTVKGYKQEYKTSGSKKSYDDWILSKGYGTRSGCTIM